MSGHKRRVVVTGIGAVTPIAFGDAALHEAMCAGRSGARKISAFDIGEYKAQTGCEVDNAQLAAALQACGLRASDRALDMALVACAQALVQSGVRPADGSHLACGTIFGTGIGSSQSMFSAFSSFFQKGLKGLRPTSVPRCMANAISAQISMAFKLNGTNYVVISACTSSTVAIGIGWRMIRDGYADVVLCGGTDAVFDPFVYGGWNNLGVMSTNPDPLKACRPFDAARDGCMLGEGAGALVLEAEEHAARRGARVRAEIAGYGESSDALHITTPSPEGQAAAMRDALASAAVAPADIGFINAHGTGTRANDECEAKSIRAVFGTAADRVHVVANKSFFGHLLGACGVIETVSTILSLETRTLPPNLNLDSPDPACNLLLVRGAPQQIQSELAMKNSFGFGGTNAVLVVRRWNA